MSFDAKLTLSQLTNSANPTAKLKVIIGTTDFVKSDTESWVAFKFKMSKYNYCKITLNSSDLYDMVLEKHVWSKCKMTKQTIIENLYFDQLQSVFEKETGLYLSM